MFVGLYQCLLSMLSPNLVFLPNSLFIEKQRMVYCMSGWVSTVKCPCQNMLKQTFLQLKHDMGSSKIVSCGLFNQWRQWLSTFWLNGWFASSLITGNVMSEFCETSPSFPINNFYIVIKSLKFSPKNSFQKENNYLIRDWGSEIWIFNGLYWFAGASGKFVVRPPMSWHTYITRD